MLHDRNTVRMVAEPARPIPRFALRPQEAADSMGVSLSTFLKWVSDGIMPKPVHQGAICLYDTEAVRKAWESMKERAGADASGNPWDK